MFFLCVRISYDVEWIAMHDCHEVCLRSWLAASIFVTRATMPMSQVELGLWTYIIAAVYISTDSELVLARASL